MTVVEPSEQGAVEHEKAGLGSRVRGAYGMHGEKLRFLLVGGWNSVFAWAIFALLLYVLGDPLASLAGAQSQWLRWLGSHNYLLVQWIAWVVAVSQSTMAFKYLVFTESGGHSLRQIARSYVVYVPLQILATVQLWLYSGVFGMHPILGQLITMSVNAVLSYIGHRHFTFRMARPAERESLTAVPADASEGEHVSRPA